jgi:hypothetical protein
MQRLCRHTCPACTVWLFPCCVYSLGSSGTKSRRGNVQASIREWTANMRVVIPGLGERVEEKEGIFAEYARGVSLEVLNLKVLSRPLFAVLFKLHRPPNSD